MFETFCDVLHFYGKTLEKKLHMFEIILSQGEGVYIINYINCYTGKTKYFATISEEEANKDMQLVSSYILKKIEIEVQYQNIQEDKDRLEVIESNIKDKGICIPF
mgnify:FL=1